MRHLKILLNVPQFCFALNRLRFNELNLVFTHHNTINTLFSYVNIKNLVTPVKNTIAEEDESLDGVLFSLMTNQCTRMSREDLLIFIDNNVY